MEVNNGFENIINKINQTKIAILGDAMLDVYIHGSSERLAREAPVPVTNVQSQDYAPGGAANTAFNVASLGARAMLFSVIGKDAEGAILLEELEKRGVDANNVLADKARLTLAKRRVVTNSQVSLRLDSGSTNQVGSFSEARLIEILSKNLPSCQALIISDYGYGVLTPRIIEYLSEFLRENHIVVAGDSRDLRKFKFKFTFVKPSYKEAVELLGLGAETSDRKRIAQIQKNGNGIFRIINSFAAAITLDKAGAVILENNGNAPYYTLGKTVPESQTVGAGDTYISAFSGALASGAGIKEAAEFAALACKIAVSKDGTIYCTLSELKKGQGETNKILQDRNLLKLLADKLRAQDKKIVFTNGCFDILHSGHVAFLKKARDLGDVLIVGVNSDESVRALKGETRPVNQLEDRMQVLAGLSSVDYLISFSELTPINLIKTVKPDVFTKGGDYSNKKLPEAEILNALGSKIVILPLVPDKSTTAIIKKVEGLNFSKKFLNQLDEA